MSSFIPLVSTTVLLSHLWPLARLPIPPLHSSLRPLPFLSPRLPSLILLCSSSFSRTRYVFISYRRLFLVPAVSPPVPSSVTATTPSAPPASFYSAFPSFRCLPLSQSRTHPAASFLRSLCRSKSTRLPPTFRGPSVSLVRTTPSFDPVVKSPATWTDG